MLARHDPEHILDNAVSALAAGSEFRALFDELPVPIYTTDREGIAFAGREPQLGQDRWCVTWQLYTMSGEPLRHEDCPMADAVRQQRAVRDVIAIAERPDGSRVAFKPYPTPLFNAAGAFTGAVNLLIDVTEEQSEALHEQAERCRRLADATYDRATSKVLGEMASGFEHIASKFGSKKS
jgi:hypothetical protein